MGGTPDKNFCDETKILLGIWTVDHGRDNRRFFIVYGFKTILTIYGYICIIYNKCNRYINNISQRCSSVCQVKILDKKVIHTNYRVIHIVIHISTHTTKTRKNRL